VLVLVGCWAFTWSWLRGWPAFQSDSLTGHIATGYQVCCLLACFVGIVGFTLARRLRPLPAFLTSNHTKTVDVAAELGYRPVGRGRSRPLAYLPGNEIFQVDFSEKTFHLPRLPAEWDGLTILHLTDLHMHGVPDKAFFRWVIDHCLNSLPDIVAVTGDIADGPTHHRWILPILGRLRWRVAGFAILGNHDLWYDGARIRRRLSKAGLRVLGNHWEQIELRGQPLTVIGNEGPWVSPGPDLSKCPAPGFRLCLSHTPDNIRWAQRNQIDLMLSGHNHGGQIRFPVIGSVLAPSVYGTRYDSGTFSEPPTALHVGRGLAGKQPLRYNCRPEVTRLILKSSKSKV
jgi:predicted MPP superfamily phosphohydrolase